jgi:hypothetical protein
VLVYVKTVDTKKLTKQFCYVDLLTTLFKCDPPKTLLNLHHIKNSFQIKK